jgi:hypothetical protein
MIMAMEQNAEPQPQRPRPTPTLEQLRCCGYDAILAQNAIGEYSIMDGLLSHEAKASKDSDDDARAGALWFLARVSSMMLTPTEKATPFLPLATWSDGRRTMIPEDLSAEEVEMLAGLAADVKNDMLRARLADLVWMKARKKGIAFAHMAIDAYRMHPIDADSWHMGGASCWHRALQLSLSIGAGAGTRTVEINAALLTAFWKAANAENFEPLLYVRPLYAEGCAVGEAENIAAQYEKLGHARMKTGRPSEAQDFFDMGERWYERARQPDKQAEMLALAAASWAAQGDANGSAIARHHFYTKAIAVYRDVPARYRNQHCVDAVIDALRAKLAVAGSQALGEMKPIKGATIDLTDLVSQAISLVQGKAPMDALLAFCDLHPLPNKARLLKQSEELLAQSIVGRLFGAVSFSGDGRAIAKHDGAMDGANAHAAAVTAGAVKDCVRRTAMIAHGMIEPALDVMQIESLLTPLDFYSLSSYSPFVPRDRADLVAKALYAGYCRDFEQAIHILVPQFEHMVRMTLKEVGSHTTTHDSDGIDMETGLSTLIDRPQTVEVFGDDLTFTIRAIMCEQEGPNLRNAVAHGLANSALCNGNHGVYAWWLVLRLVTQSFVAMIGDAQEEPEPSAGASGAAPKAE